MVGSMRSLLPYGFGICHYIFVECVFNFCFVSAIPLLYVSVR